jgi:hypothetical protein
MNDIGRDFGLDFSRIEFRLGLVNFICFCVASSSDLDCQST